MKVLSLFDGLSGAQIALNRLGVTPEYYASEIDNYAIQITQKNFPGTVQLGDVTKLNKNNLPDEIDLLIGGSPCTDLSRAKNGGEGLEGEQSRLFWEYVRLLNEINPRYFVLENVQSMKTKDFVVITNTLGVEPIMLDAGLVSAQRRKRYFWTNIPGVKQPTDRGLVIADILDPAAQRDVVKIDPSRLIKTSYGVRWNGHQKTGNLGDQGCQAQNTDEKAPTLNCNVGKAPPRIVGSGGQSCKAIDVNQKGHTIDAGLGGKYPYRIVKANSFRNQPTGRCAQEVTQKSFCVTPGCVSKNHLLIVRNPFTNPQGMSAVDANEKDFSLASSKTRNKALIVVDQNHQQDRAFGCSTKHGTLASTRLSSKTIFVFEDLRIEKLTWNEIERLAGLPIGYTDLGEGKNKSDHRGRAIGNGFQIDIIVHLLSYLLPNPEPLKRSSQRIKGEQISLF